MDTARYQVTKKVTIISAVKNSALSIAKIIIGYVGHSHSLVADGLHSLSDLVTDGFVLLAAKAGGQLPDTEHPYGHQRIETLATIIIAFILIFVAGTICYDTINHLVSHQELPIPSFSVIVITIISLGTNEWLYHYTKRVGQQYHSSLLKTAAWHNRSDAFVSFIVLVSVVGVMLGLRYLDLVGAILIALLIFKIGFGMIWKSTKELIDTGVDAETLAAINASIATVPGVLAIHQLRTRLHGENIFIDVHILVDPYISVTEGHHISERVQLKLLQEFEKIIDVTVHIDPEEDEIFIPSLNLPNRKDLHQQLDVCWKDLPGYPNQCKTTLHYIEGKLNIDVYLPQSLVNGQEQQLFEAYQKRVEHIPYIGKVTLHFVCGK